MSAAVVSGMGVSAVGRTLAMAGAVFVLALNLAWAGPAMAGQRVELRPAMSAAGLITLGDLFENAGAASQTVVGNAAPAGQSAVLDAAAVQRIARQYGLDWANADNLQRIVVPSSGVHSAVGAAQMVEVLTYARSLMAGDIVQPEDLAFTKVASFAVSPDAPRGAEEVIGKAARRPLRSGAAVAAHDVTPPQVIKRDDIVRVAYSADGVNLTLDGKSMGAAAVGETVAIMNTNSKKVIQAVAVGVDQAVVGPDADQIRAAALIAPSRIAALR
jgi:flagella basal body P-ring formation protein FlgA